jgi:hypothetical protein
MDRWVRGVAGWFTLVLLMRVLVSAPYSYSCDVVPPDAEDVLEVAHGAAAALRNVHGTAMTVRVFGASLDSRAERGAGGHAVRDTL